MLVKIKISGMTCPDCANANVKSLLQSKAVVSANGDFAKGVIWAYVTELKENDVAAAVKSAGYGYEGYEKIEELSYDIAIVGGGSAAFAAAIYAAEAGKRVAVIEKDIIGGTCLNRGCVPTKHLLDVTAGQGRKYHISALIDRKNSLLSELRQMKYYSILDSYENIHSWSGIAEFRDSTSIEVDKNFIIRFTGAIIATGARPKIAHFPGLEKVKYYTTREMLQLKEIPKKLVILGGRASALEFAQIYIQLGSEVTVLQRSERIAPNEEHAISEKLKEYMLAAGVNIFTGTKVTGIDKKSVYFEHEGAKKEADYTHLLVATGRQPNTDGMGLENVGVAVDEKGFIKVDEFYRTNAENIYAAGDCIGKEMLVTTAAKEGRLAARNFLESTKLTVSYEFVPHAIFTAPEVASVGLKEADAIAEGYEVETRILPMSSVPRALAMLDDRGIVKMVADKKTHKVLGVHILALHASEIIHQAVLILRQGMTLEDVIDKLDVYPTLSEAVKLCALSFFKDVNKLSCCSD